MTLAHFTDTHQNSWLINIDHLVSIRRIVRDDRRMIYVVKLVDGETFTIDQANYDNFLTS